MAAILELLTQATEDKMKAPKTDITGRFTNSFSSLGRNFQADARIYTGVGRAAERLFNTLATSTQQYIEEKSKETPEQRLFKLEKEREINQKIAEDAAIFRYKPQEFVEKSQKSKAQFLSQIPDDQWNWANELYESQINKYHSVITTNQIALNKRKQTLAFEEQGAEYKNQALTAAANGDLAGLAEFSVKWQENEEYLFNNGFLTPEAKMRRAKDFANAAVIQQNLAGAKTIFADQQKLSSYIQNIDNSKIYTPEQKKSIKNTILSEYSSWQAFNKVKATDMVKAADFGIKAYSMGLNPKNFDFDKTLADLKATGQVEKAQQLETAYTIKEETESFAKLSLPQMAEELNGMKNNLNDENDINRYKLFTEIAKTAEKEINEDPLLYAEQHGVIKNEPLDVTNQASFNTRMKNAIFVQEKYGLEEAPVIKKNEAEALKRTIANLAPEAKAALLSQINTNFGEHAGQIFESVSPDNPEFAVAGKIFARNPIIAANIINGTAIAQNEKGFMPTQNTNLNNAFGQLDQALSNFDTEDIAKVKKAIIANMTYINKKNNIYADGDALDSDKTLSAEEAIEQVLGGKITKMSVGDDWFGERYFTILPENVDRDDFDNWFDNLKNKNFGKIYANGMKVTAENIVNAGKLNYDDNNQYTVSINGDIVRYADGKPFVLTYGD